MLRLSRSKKTALTAALACAIGSFAIGSMAEGATRALAPGGGKVFFGVTDTGEVRDVRSLSTETEDNKNQLSRLRPVVRTSHFRPIIIDGVPQRSANNVFRYRYWY